MSPRHRLTLGACVRVCARVGVRCPPLLVRAVAGAPPAAGVPCQSCPLPGCGVWGHCWGAGMPAWFCDGQSRDLPRSLRGCPRASEVAPAELGVVAGDHRESPSCQGRGGAGGSPSPHRVSLVGWEWGSAFLPPPGPPGQGEAGQAFPPAADCVRGSKPHSAFSRPRQGMAVPVSAPPVRMAVGGGVSLPACPPRWG